MGILQNTKNIELIITRVTLNRLTPNQQVHVVYGTKYLDENGVEQVEVYGAAKCINFTRELYDEYAALEGLPPFAAPGDHTSGTFDSYMTSLLYPFIVWLIANGHARVG